MKYKHANSNYICPICLGIKGIESNDTLLRKQDLIYQDDLVSVFVNSFFEKNSEGHVIIVPNKHFENIYELPSEYGCRIFEVAKKMAIVIKKHIDAME